jgi:hypothetical protein
MAHTQQPFEEGIERLKDQVARFEANDIDLLTRSSRSRRAKLPEC